VSRIFLSHSSRDNRPAIALKGWLSEQRPELANEIFLDISPDTGLHPGQRWKDALRAANDRCQAVICLLSRDWEASPECNTEYRTAETLGKQILVARLEDLGDTHVAAEWQRCDLFAEGAKTAIPVAGGRPVRFNTAGLRSLRKALEGTGIGPENFVWPPTNDPQRAPYRGWEPFEDIDAGVFFGRDAAILRGLDELRAMRLAGVKSMFVVLGPSGSGKSSFLRAGLIPRLQRDDRQFLTLGIMRPGGNALAGDQGFAAAIHSAREAMRLHPIPLADIKSACLNDPDRVVSLLAEVQAVAARRLVDAEQEGPPPTLVLPLDQAEELLSDEAGPQAERFLTLIADVANRPKAPTGGLIVAATIRTDRYEVMQNHPALGRIGTVLFDELKPMPPTQFIEVITGPAARANRGGQRLRIAPNLVTRLIQDASLGADTLPLLSLTLAQLYTDYAGAGEITLVDYEDMGGMHRVVQGAIEDVLSANPTRRTEQLEFLRAAFVPWLATIADNDEAVRRVALESELPTESAPLISALVEKRLLVRGERDGQVVVEVALESLLRQWEDLDGWLREERHNLKTADDIERNAAEWEAHDHDSTWLVGGTRLIDAEKLANTAGFRDRLAGAHAYLAACRDTETRNEEAKEALRQKELREAEERARTAELRAAQDRQGAAEAMAAAAQEVAAVARAHAAVLHKRSRVLRMVLAVTAVIAVVAIVAFIEANAQRHQAQLRFRDSSAFRLTTDAALALPKNPSDSQAIQELLAARALAGPTVDPQIQRITASAGLGATTTELCAKLTTNMSHKQWHDWVSPDISYLTVCPGLPIAHD
jgi:hypothetical protein